MQERTLKTLTLDGGVQPFHLINTVYACRGENLHEYADVLTWCAKVDLLKKEDLKALKQAADEHPIAAQKAFQKIIDVRALLYQFFSAVAADDKPTVTQLLPAFNKQLQEALLHFAWMPSKQGLQFMQEDVTSLLRPLWLVVKSAHDILLSENSARIKECPRCGWIFLDTTKNGKRRWCNPQDCGSVEKARRYYRKKVKASL